MYTHIHSAYNPREEIRLVVIHTQGSHRERVREHQ